MSEVNFVVFMCMSRCSSEATIYVIISCTCESESPYPLAILD